MTDATKQLIEEETTAAEREILAPILGAISATGIADPIIAVLLAIIDRLTKKLEVGKQLDRIEAQSLRQRMKTNNALARLARLNHLAEAMLPPEVLARVNAEENAENQTSSN